MGKGGVYIDLYMYNRFRFIVLFDIQWFSATIKEKGLLSSAVV